MLHNIFLKIEKRHKLSIFVAKLPEVDIFGL